MSLCVLAATPTLWPEDFIRTLHFYYATTRLSVK
jgi:hypothetical protein